MPGEVPPPLSETKVLNFIADRYFVISVPSPALARICDAELFPGPAASHLELYDEQLAAASHGLVILCPRSHYRLLLGTNLLV